MVSQGRSCERETAFGCWCFTETYVLHVVVTHAHLNDLLYTVLAVCVDVEWTALCLRTADEILLAVQLLAHVLDVSFSRQLVRAVTSDPDGKPTLRSKRAHPTLNSLLGRIILGCQVLFFVVANAELFNITGVHADEYVPTQ